MFIVDSLFEKITLKRITNSIPTRGIANFVLTQPQKKIR